MNNNSFVSRPDTPCSTDWYRENSYHDDHQYQQPQRSFQGDELINSFHCSVRSGTGRVCTDEHVQHREAFRSNMHSISLSDAHTQNESSVATFLPPMLNTSHKGSEHSHFRSGEGRMSYTLNESPSSHEIGSDHESHFWSKRQFPHSQASSKCDVISGAYHSNTVSSDDHLVLPSSRQLSPVPLGSDARSPVPLMSLFNGHRESRSDNESYASSFLNYEGRPKPLFPSCSEKNSYTTEHHSTYYHSGSASITDECNSVLHRLGSKIGDHVSDMQCNPDPVLLGNDCRRDGDHFSDMQCNPDPILLGNDCRRADVLSRLGPETQSRNSGRTTTSNPEHIHHHNHVPGLLCHSSNSQPDFGADSCQNTSGSSLPTDFLSPSLQVIYPPGCSTGLDKFIDTDVEQNPSSPHLPFRGNSASRVSEWHSDISVDRRSITPSEFRRSSSNRNAKGLSDIHSSRSKQNTRRVSGTSIKSVACKSQNIRELSSNKIPADWLVDFAKRTVGNVAKYLDSSTDNLLKCLHEACVAVISFMSKQKKFSKFKVLQVLCDHFSGFFCNDLISACTFPSTTKLLFKSELTYLRSICGVDLNNWRKNIVQFVSLTKDMSTAFSDVAESDFDVVEKPSVSPQPLVMDLGPAYVLGYTAESVSNIDSCPIVEDTSIACDVESETQHFSNINMFRRMSDTLAKPSDLSHSYSEPNEKSVRSSELSDCVIAEQLSKHPRRSNYVGAVSNACSVTQSDIKPALSSLSRFAVKCGTKYSDIPQTDNELALCLFSSKEFKPASEKPRQCSYPCESIEAKPSSCSSTNTGFQRSVPSSGVLKTTPAQHTSLTELSEISSATDNVAINPDQQHHRSGTEYRHATSLTTMTAKPLENPSVASCLSNAVICTQQVSKPFPSWSSFELEMQSRAPGCIPGACIREKQTNTALLDHLSHEENVVNSESFHSQTGLDIPVLASDKTPMPSTQRDDLSPGEIVSTSPSPSPPPVTEKRGAQKSKGKESCLKTKQRESEYYSDRRNIDSKCNSKPFAYLTRSYRQQSSKGKSSQPSKRKSSQPSVDVRSKSKRYNQKSRKSLRKSYTLESEEELELLDLRKKALMSMIEEKMPSSLVR